MGQHASLGLAKRFTSSAPLAPLAAALNTPASSWGGGSGRRGFRGVTALPRDSSDELELPERSGHGGSLGAASRGWALAGRGGGGSGADGPLMRLCRRFWGRGGSSGTGPGSGGSAALCRRDGPPGGSGGGAGLTRSQETEVVSGGGGATRAGARQLYSHDCAPLAGGSEPASLPMPLSFMGLPASRLSTVSLSASSAVRESGAVTVSVSDAVSLSEAGPAPGATTGPDTTTGTGAGAITADGMATRGPVCRLVRTGFGGSGGGFGLVVLLLTTEPAEGPAGAGVVPSSGAEPDTEARVAEVPGADSGAATEAVLTASAGAMYSSGDSVADASSFRGWPSKLREVADETSLGGRGGGSGRGKFSGIISEKFNIISWHSAPSTTAGV